MGTTAAADKRRDELAATDAMDTYERSSSQQQLHVQKPLPPKTRLTLERVLGVTSLSNAMLAVNPVTGEIAYAAGCIVVIYNLRRNKQVRYYRVEKTVSCLCFSHSGQYLAIGEKGYLPAITIWDGSDGTLCAELQMHKYGVACMAFSRDGRYLLSAGLVHDQHIFAWDLRRDQPGEPMQSKAVGVATVTEKVLAMDYCHEGNFFVTVGEKHFQYWFLDTENKFLTTGFEVNGLPEIQGRAAVMAAKEDATFTSVGCGFGSCKLKTFAVTADGTLCSFGVSCVMERLVSLEASCGNAISVTESYIAVGGASSVIRLFDPSTLEYKATMPFAPPFGSANEPLEAPSNQLLQPDRPHRYPATIGVRLTGSHLVALYSDRSLFIYDISNPQHAQADRSFLFHSGCVRDLKIAGRLRGVNGKGKLVYHGIDSLHSRKSKSEGSIPLGTFVTCGDDNTVRFWNLDTHRPPKSSRFVGENAKESGENPEDEPWKNPFSQEMLHVMYHDDKHDFDDEHAVVLGGTCAWNDLADIHVPTKDPGSANAQRAVAIHPNLTMLASGDKQGGLFVQALPLYDQTPIELSSSGSEIHCLAFNEMVSPLGSKYIVAAGGRDRLVHVYDSSKELAQIGKLDNHSAAVTALLFTSDGKKMISCGADKNIVLSDVSTDGKIARYNSIPFASAKVFDVALTSDDEHLVASSNNRLDVLNVNSGKMVRTLHVGEQHHIDVCPANFCVAMSGSLSDKTIHVVDIISGEVLADGTGHGEGITGIKFTPDCRRLVSASSDGCIFVWRLAEELQAAIKARLPRATEVHVPPPPAPPVVQVEKSAPALSVMPPPAPPVMQAKRIISPSAPVPSISNPASDRRADPKTAIPEPSTVDVKKDGAKGWKGKAKAIPGPMSKIPMEEWMRTRESAKKTVHVDDEKTPDDPTDESSDEAGVLRIDRSKTPDWARTFQVSNVPAPKQTSPPKPSKWSQRTPAVPQAAQIDGLGHETTTTEHGLSNLSLASMDVSQSAASLTGSSLALEREQLEKRKKQLETAKAVADMNSRLSKLGLLKPQRTTGSTSPETKKEKKPEFRTTPVPEVKDAESTEALQNRGDRNPLTGIPVEMFESIDAPPPKVEAKVLANASRRASLTSSIDLQVNQSMSAFTSGFTTEVPPSHTKAPSFEPQLGVDQSLSAFSVGYNDADAQTLQKGGWRVASPVRDSTQNLVTNSEVGASLSAFTDGFRSNKPDVTKSLDMTSVAASMSSFTDGYGGSSAKPVSVSQSVDLSSVKASMSSFTDGYAGDLAKPLPVSVSQSIDLRAVGASLSHFTTGYESADVVDVSKKAVPEVAQSLSSFTSGFATTTDNVRTSTSTLRVNESLSNFTTGYANTQVEESVGKPPEVAISLSSFTSGYSEDQAESPPPPAVPTEQMSANRAAAAKHISTLDLQLQETVKSLKDLAVDGQSDPELIELNACIVQLRTAIAKFAAR